MPYSLHTTAQNALLVSSSVQPFSSIDLNVVVTSAWAVTLAVNCTALAFSILLLGYLFSLPEHDALHMASFMESTGGWLAAPAVGTVLGAAMLPAALIIHVFFLYMEKAGWEMLTPWAFLAIAIVVFIIFFTYMLVRAATKIGRVTAEVCKCTTERRAREAAPVAGQNAPAALVPPSASN